MPQKDEDSAKKPAPPPGPLERYSDRDQLKPQGDRPKRDDKSQPG